MEHLAWQQCVEELEIELQPIDFNTWIRPLQADVHGKGVVVYAPNVHVRETVDQHFAEHIRRALAGTVDATDYTVEVRVGEPARHAAGAAGGASGPPPAVSTMAPPARPSGPLLRLKSTFTFDNFVSGRSNQIAVAAAEEVARHPGEAYNPLFIYGGVGLGKTHLMQAVGNTIAARNPDARIVYQSSEGFVRSMVNSIQSNEMEAFKRHYRTANVLLMDDVQFLARKPSSQEEFFHTFNELLQAGQQIVMTCDRFAKAIDGLEERLKSRFTSGMPVPIEPPELETRAAILIRKAQVDQVELSQDIAMFIAHHIRSNVRELEGVFRRVTAHARLLGSPITLEITREAISDVLAVHSRQTTVDNIQNTVATFYKLRVSDLVAKRRTRTIVRPRQIAMALAKELTSHSYPELGALFGGRDHTTVMHACKQVEKLRASDLVISDEYDQLRRMLVG